MAELADAHGSGPCGSNTLWVRLPSSAVYEDPWDAGICGDDQCFQGFCCGWGKLGDGVDSASLHLTVGLRPMKMKGQKESYVQAQRLFLALHFRTAHCLRHVSVFLFPGVEEVGGSGLAFDGVFLEEVF